MRHPNVLLAVLLGALASACAAQQGASPDVIGSPDETRPTRSAPHLATLPPSDAPVTGEVPEEILEDLLADAAARSGVEPADIEIRQAQAVTWNDGSLGCPEPGMSYTMALVEGYHVLLEAGSDELDYRVTADGTFRLCENGRRPSG